MACSPPSWLEPSSAGPATNVTCTLFGGAANSEDDHFDDTWVWQTRDGVYGGKPHWQQSQPAIANPGPKPAGRWSFQLASCGTGTLMAGGSIGYRICADDTWTFNATIFPSPWTTKGATPACETALISGCGAAQKAGVAACDACLGTKWKTVLAPAGCVGPDATGFCKGAGFGGVNHDAVGEWQRADTAGGPSPGFLGGAMMARVAHGGSSGVLHFGGIAFDPGTTHIGPESNATHFWPVTSCP